MARDTKLKFVREVYGVAMGSPTGTGVRVGYQYGYRGTRGLILTWLPGNPGSHPNMPPPVSGLTDTREMIV